MATVALPDVKPVIVDVTFIVEADEHGRALLLVMHRFGASANNRRKDPNRASVIMMLLRFLDWAILVLREQSRQIPQFRLHFGRIRDRIRDFLTKEFAIPLA
jgi:hypothetical protein